MPIVAVFQHPSLTGETYAAVCRKLTGGRDRMESASDWNVDGILVHIAGETPAGFRVVDVWQSEDAFRKFGETLVPILMSLGIEAAPEVYPAHAFVLA